jgi:hypothetical protein
MDKENDKADELDDIKPADDSTDWQARAEELEGKIIRHRETRKAMKDKYESTISDLESQLALQTKETKQDKKSDGALLKRLEAMALKQAGITTDDEKELFRKWKDATGREVDEIVDNKIFQSELTELRTAQTNANAADITGGNGKDSGVKSDPTYWIGKLTKDREGNPVLPDDFPNDPRLLSQVVSGLVSSEKKTDKRFYNS